MRSLRPYLGELPLLVMAVGGLLLVTHSAGSQVGAVVFPAVAAALRRWWPSRAATGARNSGRDPVLVWLVPPAVLLELSLLEVRWNQGLDLTQGAVLGAFLVTTLVAPHWCAGWWSPVRWLAATTALLLPAWLPSQELAPGALLAALRLAILGDCIRTGLSQRDVRPDRWLDAVGLGLVLALQQSLFWFPLAVLAAATLESAAHGAFSREAWIVRPAHDRAPRWVARGCFAACIVVTALACTWSVYQLAPFGRRIHEVGPVAVAAVSRLATESFRTLKSDPPQERPPSIPRTAPASKPNLSPNPSSPADHPPLPARKIAGSTTGQARAPSPGSPLTRSEEGFTNGTRGANGTAISPASAAAPDGGTGSGPAARVVLDQPPIVVRPPAEATRVQPLAPARFTPRQPVDFPVPSDSPNAIRFSLPASVLVAPERASSPPGEARFGAATPRSAIAFQPPSLDVPSLPGPPTPELVSGQPPSSQAKDATAIRVEPRFDSVSARVVEGSAANARGSVQQSLSNAPGGSASALREASVRPSAQTPESLRASDPATGVIDPGSAPQTLASAEPGSARLATPSRDMPQRTGSQGNEAVDRRAATRSPLPAPSPSAEGGANAGRRPPISPAARATEPRSAPPTATDSRVDSNHAASASPLIAAPVAPERAPPSGDKTTPSPTHQTADSSESPPAGDSSRTTSPSTIAAPVASPAASANAPAPATAQRANSTSTASVPRPGASPNGPAETHAPTQPPASQTPSGVTTAPSASRPQGKADSTTKPALGPKPEAAPKSSATASEKDPAKPPQVPPSRSDSPKPEIGSALNLPTGPWLEVLAVALTLLAVMIGVRRWRARAALAPHPLAREDRSLAGRCLWEIENLRTRPAPPKVADELIELHHVALYLRYGIEFSRDRAVHLEREARRLRRAIDKFGQG